MTKLLLVCDDCGELIVNPRQAEVAWARYDDERKKVWVVHAPHDCPRWNQAPLSTAVSGRGTVSLRSYLGPAGLLELLNDIERGEFPLEVGFDLLRRLHVPGYEQYLLARRDAIADGCGEQVPARPGRSKFRNFLAWLKKRSGQ